jgi:lipopolysaccharide export system protein LptA
MTKKRYIITIFTFVLFLLITIPVSLATTVTIQADKQNFQVSDNTAYFEGNVKVDYGQISITSPKAVLTANEKGEPDKAVFSNGVSAIRKEKDASDKVTAENMTFMLNTNELIAQGNVHSELKQGSSASVTIRADRQEFNNASNEVRASGGVSVRYQNMNFSASQAKLFTVNGKPHKAELIGNAKINRDNTNITAGNINYDINSGNMTASNGVNTVARLKDGSRVSMSSSHQQYNKNSNIIIGSGHVKVIYQDYVATGPKATIYTTSNGDLDKIVFSGRATITDSKRKVSADIITVSMNPKNFSAEGNVQTQFAQMVKENTDTSKKPDIKEKPKPVETKTPEPSPEPKPEPENTVPG